MACVPPPSHRLHLALFYTQSLFLRFAPHFPQLHLLFIDEQDGPTHQPVETVSGLRVFPNMDVMRPADPEETAAAYAASIDRKDGPTALILTRQNVRTLKEIPVRTNYTKQAERESDDARSLSWAHVLCVPKLTRMKKMVSYVLVGAATAPLSVHYFVSFAHRHWWLNTPTWLLRRDGRRADFGALSVVLGGIRNGCVGVASHCARGCRSCKAGSLFTPEWGWCTIPDFCV